ncbi:hypothetical protein F441_07440 [Phytophthora nicotianae CJ01A1]|uniref:Uncharacterized protein n=3 Tax=Phytophthora nicotianae TaxID=4792 RepID=W2GZR5_PHYNI|nr:hypothetical protein L915_07283 [Phytophthora nicotianae]ETM48250.1 hypothetical protein L914_07179 [Phytophthora nicotianae]ETO58525.1 hypothetical protein F444_23098 [Phytophthora nicotianae P1976]ETP18310.1 hypothetical protein F441_07440 [Phytophthora nicotianae CJ01A1]
MLRSAQVLSMTGGSIAAALVKQLPALKMLSTSSIAATRRHAARPTASTDSREAKEELSGSQIN